MRDQRSVQRILLLAGKWCTHGQRLDCGTSRVLAFPALGFGRPKTNAMAIALPHEAYLQFGHFSTSNLPEG